MKPTKPVLAALGVSALAALTPAKAISTPTLLATSENTTASAPLYGAAQTSDSKLGLSSAGLFSYDNDLSNGSGEAIFNIDVVDAGSWSDTHYLTASSGGVDLMNISTGFSDGLMGLSGFGVDAVSSAFDYNGSQHFAIIDGQDNTVKYFEWGNNTPVATGPNVGSGHSGLEVITDGSASDLSSIPLLISRDTEGGVMLEQYHNGTIVGTYEDARGRTITDISYDASSGVLTASHDARGRFGEISNYDFGIYAVPEAKDFGLILGAGALAGAAYSRRRK